MPTIYRKSAKGLHEIETRAHRLVPRLRSALILVDGKRSDDELRSMLLQQPDETLATLLGQGFIELVAVTAPPREAPRPAAPQAPPAPAKAAGAEFEAQRRNAVRELNELLGPVAETLALRIEKTKTAEELRVQLGSAQQAIVNMRGAAAAQAFAARFASV